MKIVKDYTCRPKICVLGGGRWGREIIKSLVSLNFSREIIWVTSFYKSQNETWLIESGYSPVKIESNIDEALKQKPKFVVIANQTGKHGEFIKLCADYRLACLSEKPFATSHGEALELVDYVSSRKIICGVNLEYFYASYMNDFVNKFRNKNLKQIKITWHDQEIEFRRNSKKQAELTTNITHDLLPHCLSLLYRFLGHSTLHLQSVTYKKTGQVIVIGERNNNRVIFSLHRRAAKRKRRIDINCGQNILDFSDEPGFEMAEGKRKCNMAADIGPLSASLLAFDNQVTLRTTDFCNSITNCLEMVKFADQATDILVKSQNKILESAFASNGWLEDKNNLKIVLEDFFLPALGSQHKLGEPDISNKSKMFELYCEAQKNIKARGAPYL